ncbi:MAG: hypothetical protein KC478_02815 [Bacteriovoracaceae bacterium]|nr:hypothetical protein [Bacteriovoracaceae bacterium]
MKDYQKELEKTLNSNRLDYGILAKILFITMDILYGKKRTILKFKVLEIIARVPYQAWEQVAYVAITHNYSSPKFARRIFDFVKEAREQQDNEQWHLLIVEELVEKMGIKKSLIKHRIMPQIIALTYYYISWILYVINPKLSYKLNAHFEDHAEHEYMLFVNENEELMKTPYESSFEDDYGKFDTLRELFIQIGLDERHHKEESLARIASPRFS